MSKRGTTRQGFGGNYRRSGETNPNKPLSPGVSSVKPSFKDVESPTSPEMYAMDTHSSRGESPRTITVTKVLESGSPLKPLNKDSWGKRTYYPAVSPKQKSDSPPSKTVSAGQITPPNRAPSSGEEEDSPSVKACIANFESMSPRSQRKFSQSSVKKNKVSELRESLLRKSNENISRVGRGLHEYDSGSLSSHSTESLDDRLCLSQSTENISNDLILRESVSREASPHKDNNNVPLPDHLLGVSSHRDQILLPSTRGSDLFIHTDAKPTSPTLESGYNSHNTPDNRSVVSELSLSSAGSGSLSIPSRNSSTVSKDSIELPLMTSQPVSVVHVRQKSLEEIECDHQAALLVRQLPEAEKRLSDVIAPPPQHKTTTDYMSGLFDTEVDPTRRPSVLGNHSNQSSLDNTQENKSSFEVDVPMSPAYWSPPSVAQLQNKMREEGIRTDDVIKADGNSLLSQKAELIGRIEKKLDILNGEKADLDQEVVENNNIGKQLINLVEEKAANRHDINKFKIFLDELDTVLKLLLKVSGQLARAENAVMTGDVDDKELMALKMKRDDLVQKHDDAKQLKEGIDLRGQLIASVLKKCLTAEQFTDYEYFIKMKSKLKMEQQEIDDKISLGEEQLNALKKML